MDSMITRTIEQMGAQVFEENAITMKHYGDDNTLVATKVIEYFTETRNPAVYTPAVAWDNAEADILGDVYQMALMLTKRGLPAVDLILGTEAADAVLNNEKILKLLDNRNFNLGAVDPTENFPEAVFLGQINCKGYKLNFIQYAATYEAEDGTIKPYINPKSAIVTAPNCGVTNYGAITQIDFGNIDFTTYAEKRVPLYSVKDQVREVALRSAPLVQPKNKNAFTKATVLF